MANETIRAVVKGITFKGERGYTVAKVLPDKGKSVMTVVGNMDLVKGETVDLEGCFVDHARFGRQFEVKSVRQNKPENEKDVMAFLAGGFLKGVGPATAAAIVAKFGDRSRDALEGHPSMLSSVPGIGKKKGAAIRKAWKDSMANRDVNIVLAGWGVSPTMACRITAKHGSKAAEVIRDNPYLLARSVDGIGFRKADAIALGSGMDPDDIKRVEAAAVHVVCDFFPSKGHCFTPVDDLVDGVKNLVSNATVEKILEAIERLETEKTLVRENDMIWPFGLLAAEKALAERVVALAEKKTILDKAVVDKAVKSAADSGVELAPEQLAAVTTALENGLSIITGGPGTGKTTVVRTVIKAAGNAGVGPVILMAPTGRAAKRLEETSGMKAGTAHRVLGFNPETGWNHDAKNPLRCGLLIVDEMSMADTPLARRILEAADDRTRVVLVGDVNQLPSVGPGNVLGDLIASGKVRVTELTRIFRQDENSYISVNAKDVNSGRMPALVDGNDVRFMNAALSANGGKSADVSQRAADLAVEAVTTLVRDGADPEDIRVLAPTYKGSCGVDALNSRLQSLFNPNWPGKPSVTRPDGSRMSVGDKVMNLRNDYDRMVFNGDVGTVASVLRGGELVVDFDGRDVSFRGEAKGNLTLAYAATVHKSQGSEYPFVVSVFVDQHGIMLQRALLYTSMTRASKMHVMVGTRSAVATCVQNRMSDDKRNTMLAERLT